MLLMQFVVTCTVTLATRETSWFASQAC